MSFEVTIKISGVGKSCIKSRVMDNDFKEKHNATIGVNLVLSSLKLMENSLASDLGYRWTRMIQVYGKLHLISKLLLQFNVFSQWNFKSYW